VTIRCADCGKFIPTTQLVDDSARFFYQPDSEYGHEISEWTCAGCVQKEKRQAETEERKHQNELG
jgi:hypothetical protein